MNTLTYTCPQDVKEAVYKSMVRPILEYGSTVWDPHCNGLNDELKNVQKRAARFVTRNYSYETGRMTLTKMKRLLQGCSSVAATMQQSNMYATTGGDKVAN